MQASADATGALAKTLTNLVAHSDATSNARSRRAQPTPLNGIYPCRHSAATKQLALTDIMFARHTPASTEGKISDPLTIAVAVGSMTSTNLKRLSAALARATPGQPPSQPLGLYGLRT